ncbi:5'-nucleotidase C-terminal domain-containing protein [Microbacterium jejuense]|uniref:5'-nucleotidase C-terminal domain-containing protein n=1 Tax=Microbacterium jejuense TaxID=1263637 RepID=A0ABS7HP34_9MICO|nr:5'-nucleotidase C-terminal domain-containing protein [Microbacterium jejuense]MBW9093972.1 5'-nucleotidase C-terminal domain-containing protein [Microbacterium jejuense]
MRSGPRSAPPSLRRRLALGASAVTVAALATGGLAVPAAYAATTDVQILATNDFHGRILDNTGNGEAGAAVLAGAVKQLRAANPNTVFAAAGDLIGASTFESFIQHDKPTIDALNAAGLEVSAVGNHELDQGYDDLVNRVMAPYDAVTNPYGGANWQYIAANLKMKATGDPAVPATWIKEVGGVQVGFVGAVTEDLPTLVSPGGIADITVDDIVTSVNTEAADLVAEGADLVVMLVHEGAPSTDCTTMDDSGTWADIVNNVSPDVDAIVSGHTHLAYNCSFPVAAWQSEGRAVTDRPVVSAGQYGTNLNQLVFSVDDAGNVTAKTQKILALEHPVTVGTTTTWVADYPADPEVQSIADAAKKQAEVLGAVELGKIAGPFNRAKLANGTSENRGGESTLGNLVAEVQRWATEKPESGSAQIAFMNPGGLRQDMVGSNAAGYPATLTYQQAAVVQPFANTLVNMQLTGAQIKKVLEQQWQRDALNKVATRPFLRLGVSDGFTYTYSQKDVTEFQKDDPKTPDVDESIISYTAPRGTVTGMWLNGEPIDAASTYSVTVNSFLATGGDNFFELANGTAKRDTGKADLAAMVDYMATFAASTPLPVDYAQHAVEIGFPAGAPSAYDPGATVAFGVKSWAMSTAADAKDSQIDVSLDGVALGSFPVDNTIGTEVYDNYGTAAVSVALPSDVARGTTVELTLTGAQTGTSVVVPVAIDKADSTTVGTPNKTFANSKGNGVIQYRTTVTTEDGTPVTGDAVIYDGGEPIATVTLTAEDEGTVQIKLPKLGKGSHPLYVVYGGSDTVKPSTSATVTVEVK